PCPCCKGDLHQIGEDKSERLDLVPAQFRIVVTRRPKYACRSCEDGVLQAPVPARLIEGGLPTEATVAQVLVSKYADHLPLYRQAQIYARQGIELDRSTLADWVGHASRAERAQLELAFCWPHVRPKYYDRAPPGPAPIASETRKRIAEIYAIEKDIRGRSAEERRLVRQQKSRLLAQTFEQWLRA